MNLVCHGVHDRSVRSPCTVIKLHTRARAGQVMRTTGSESESESLLEGCRLATLGDVEPSQPRGRREPIPGDWLAHPCARAPLLRWFDAPYVAGGCRGAVSRRTTSERLLLALSFSKGGCNGGLRRFATYRDEFISHRWTRHHDRRTLDCRYPAQKGNNQSARSFDSATSRSF